MPMCSWCGRLTSQPREYANGSTVLRLCPECAGSQSAEKLVSSLPARGLAAVVEDREEIPGAPGWIRWTAMLLLLTFLVGFVSVFLL